jgi:hypothetical protein
MHVTVVVRVLAGMKACVVTPIHVHSRSQITEGRENILRKCVCMYVCICMCVCSTSVHVHSCSQITERRENILRIVGVCMYVCVLCVCNMHVPTLQRHQQTTAAECTAHRLQCLSPMRHTRSLLSRTHIHTLTHTYTGSNKHIHLLQRH